MHLNGNRKMMNTNDIVKKCVIKAIAIFPFLFYLKMEALAREGPINTGKTICKQK